MMGLSASEETQSDFDDPSGCFKILSFRQTASASCNRAVGLENVPSPRDTSDFESFAPDCSIHPSINSKNGEVRRASIVGDKFDIILRKLIEGSSSWSLDIGSTSLWVLVASLLRNVEVVGPFLFDLTVFHSSSALMENHKFEKLHFSAVNMMCSNRVPVLSPHKKRIRSREARRDLLSGITCWEMEVMIYE